ncbi:MAG TPA: GNAT family N-acetyltransferase, partial [Ktedonobacterales bacterium]
MTPITIRQATENDWPQMAALLETAQLTLAGAKEHLAEFLLAFHDQTLVGTAALERYGATALLRSVAILPSAQGQGLGQTLVSQVLEQTSKLGIRQVVLLTTTATDYFPRFGFAPISRADVPLAVHAS